MDPEAALIHKIQARDTQAYRTLSDRYLKSILNYSSRILMNQSEAEDVCQETFLRLWTRADSYRDTGKVSTWLFRIAHNLCVDRLRKRKPGGEDVTALTADSQRASDLLDQRRRAELVQHAIARLPVRQRSALLMSHFEDMGNTEIATVLDVGVEAVESLLSRARRALREQLSQQLE